MGPPMCSWLNRGLLHPSETEDRGLSPKHSSAPCSGWSLCLLLQSYWGNREDSGISWKGKWIRYCIINTGLPSKVSSPLVYTLYVKLHSVHFSSVAQSCPTLCDPMDCSLPGSSIRGILQTRVLEWVAISFSRRSSQPRDRTQVSYIAGRRFTI